jgi:hypothetical protein
MKQVVADLSPPQPTWQERGTSPPLIQPQPGGSHQEKDLNTTVP